MLVLAFLAVLVCALYMLVEFRINARFCLFLWLRKAATELGAHGLPAFRILSRVAVLGWV